MHTAPALGYNRVCNLEDFDHPDLRDVIHDVAEFDRDAGRSVPGKLLAHCKYWEVAMAIRSLRDFRALRPDAEILGVAAGIEATIFWLTNHVRRVFATDRYANAAEWGAMAPQTMLTEPRRACAGSWNPRRLVVQHMDALDLAYEDGSFDGIFSSSSIEHFGGHAEIRRGAEEMCRVLKPGGILALSTAFRIEGPAPGLPGTLLFDRAEIEELFFANLPWSPVSPLETDVSTATVCTEIPFEDAVAGRGRTDQYVVLRHGPYVFTSVHLTLRKRA